MAVIPEARLEWDEGRLCRICPTCGKRVVEDSNRAGEPISDYYADHWVEYHDPDFDCPACGTHGIHSDAECVARQNRKD